jgi:hypothetical protein
MPENDWLDNPLTTILHLRMSSLFADTVYDLETGAIQSSDPVSNISPVLYSASDIFEVLNPALSNSTIQDFIATIINDNSLANITGDVEPAAMRNLMACAFYEYNWGTDWNQTWDAVPSMYGYGYYTIERFRLAIAHYSLALFMILTIGELVWAILVVRSTYCGSNLSPARSWFPEWDFACKCVRVSTLQRGTAMDSLLTGLENASSNDIIERIRSERITVRALWEPEPMGSGGQTGFATTKGTGWVELCPACYHA